MIIDAECISIFTVQNKFRHYHKMKIRKSRSYAKHMDLWVSEHSKQTEGAISGDQIIFIYECH